MKRISFIFICLITIVLFTSCKQSRSKSTSLSESSKAQSTTSPSPYKTTYQAKENSVFWMNWNTTDGVIDSGTAVCIQTNLCKSPILITPNDIFPANAFEKKESTYSNDYILGADLVDSLTCKVLDTTISKKICLSNPSHFPDISNDLSAFFLTNTKQLHTFSLSSSDCKPNDTIYLITNTTDTANANPVYSCKVISSHKGILYYRVDKDIDLSSSIGAPLVKKDGTLVGIHIGSNHSSRCALSSSQINTILKSNLNSFSYTP